MYAPAEKPTLYFIGVTTGKSAIMKIFPEWARLLELGDCAIRGIDFVPHDDPCRYRQAVSFIKSDPLSFGALVTTHKIDLFRASRDLFDEVDKHAALMGEASCISKRNGNLRAHAKDPITAGLALESFLPSEHWEKTRAEALVFGAGGSSLAITWHLMKPEHGKNRPSRIIVANRSPGRLMEMRHLHERLGFCIPVEYHHVQSPKEADQLLEGLRPGSLVINATGLGKDAPGSPVSDAAVFPQEGYVWDFNYRGDLLFVQQARAQEHLRRLRVEDGWIYFIHGWTQVIAEVFNVEIPASGPMFDKLSEAAAKLRN